MGCGSSKDSLAGTEPERESEDEASPPGEGDDNDTTEEVANDGGAVLEVLPKDEADFRPPTGEEGNEALPEGKFIHGRLGITDEQALNELRSSLNEGDEFEDPDFPAEPATIFFSDRSTKDIEWMRPKELVSEPLLFVDGVNRRDVVQGSLGDCWFLSSCSAVARERKLIERVMPPDQVLFGDGYNGMVVCCFWRFGEWVTVCTDDRLPTKDGKLLFARSADENEFWVALIEKAYAKIHGSYEAMEGGQSMDAMVDLTGGLAERYDFDEGADLKKIYKRMLTHSRNGAFITCSRKGDWRMAYKTDDNGLVEGHAYTVTLVARVKHDTLGQVNLVRVRNPWANEAEWKGVWGDKDDIWDGVPERQKAKLAVDESTGDGEFWISFEDFAAQFEEVSVCTSGPDFDKDGVVDKVERIRSMKGAWKPGMNAGGSRNNFDLFATNPQYGLHIMEPEEAEDADQDVDEEDAEDYLGTESGGKTRKSSVLIGLMQEHRRSNKDTGLKMLQIALVIYKTKDLSQPLPKEHFMYNYEDGTSGVYINYREVLARLELPQGKYIIIPATFEPQCKSDFMIRAFAECNFTLTKVK